MIIAQLTDLHIGFDGKDQICQNSLRLERVLRDIKAMLRQPDLIIFTGDLVEESQNWAYKKLKSNLINLNIPYYFAMGNHDDREMFSNVFPEASFNNGFLQYSLDNYPLRIIVLDTLEPNRHGGNFCEARENWLSKKLAEKPDQPTLIAMHHPPIDTAIGWMTAKKNDPWVQKLAKIILEYPNVVQIISGHIHRSIFKEFAGTQVSVSSAVAPQVKLDLADIDPDIPDDRILFINEPPAYCLHHWDGHHLTTHNAMSSEGQPILRFDQKHAFIIRKTMDIPS